MEFQHFDLELSKRGILERIVWERQLKKYRNSRFWSGVDLRIGWWSLNKMKMLDIKLQKTPTVHMW